MEYKAIIAITVICLFLLISLECACAFREIPPDPPELPLPTTVQQLEAGDTSDGRSSTDVNPPSYAQDEGGNTLDLPPPAVTQDGGNTFVLPPPAVTQDHEGGNTLVLPPPAVMQDKYGYNSGRPNLRSSTLLPMYMDGSDG
jgi:hypothetical protein